jgi:hypothetical protein
MAVQKHLLAKAANLRRAGAKIQHQIGSVQELLLILVLVLELRQGRVGEYAAAVAACAFEADGAFEYVVCAFYHQANAADLREDVHSAVLNDADLRFVEDLDLYAVDDLDPYGVDVLDPYAVVDLDPYGVDVLHPYDEFDLGLYGGDALDPYAVVDLDLYGGDALDPYAEVDLDPYAGDVLAQLFLSAQVWVAPDFYYFGSC